MLPLILSVPRGTLKQFRSAHLDDFVAMCVASNIDQREGEVISRKGKPNADVFYLLVFERDLMEKTDYFRNLIHASNPLGVRVLLSLEYERQGIMGYKLSERAETPTAKVEDAINVTKEEIINAAKRYSKNQGSLSLQQAEFIERALSLLHLMRAQELTPS
ncbi:hypothetical protein HYX05_00890 [Candidatus Woesearchaeota archaeon]|nr:hypothetical protein [Candidatus Woesearchaeota archaeon]